MTTERQAQRHAPAQTAAPASHHPTGAPERSQGHTAAHSDTAAKAVEIGMQLAHRAYRYMGDILGSDTSDPLGPAFGWIYHARCDCPRGPHHRWNCTLTPIWAQTVRAGYLPTMSFGPTNREDRP
jgi:hypothetical protein